MVWRELTTSDAVLKPSPALNLIDLACRKKGLRLTHQRRAIAGVLAEARDHPDIQELHRQVATFDPGISLATVYRTMKVFKEHGLVWRHAFLGKVARYEWAADVAHDHLINIADGAVTDFRSEEIERILTEVAHNLGYRVVSRRLELYYLPIEPRTSQAENAFPRSRPEVSARKPR